MTNYREPLSPEDAMDVPMPMKRWRVNVKPMCGPTSVDVEAPTADAAQDEARRIVNVMDCVLDIMVLKVEKLP